MSSSRQHYVPQFLLERFGHQTSGDIYVFNKQTGKSFTTGASRIAVEWDLYDFEFKGFPMSLEKSLSELESEAAWCIKNLLERGRLDMSEPAIVAERSALVRFLSVQLVRTRGAFERMNHISDKLKEALRSLGAPEDYFELPPEVGSSDENAQKAFLVERICTAYKDFGPDLVKKGWVLMSTTLDAPFLLGDHPVTIDNLAGGKMGINVPGAVIYFPLSPQFALALHCESLVNEIYRANTKLRNLPDEVFVQNKELYAVYNAVVDKLECLSKGIPAKLEPKNVENINSIQILEAERFVFSCDGNFELVEDMIREDSRVKTGTRFNVS
jgi:Protein of unknown function (DUF4238)